MPESARRHHPGGGATGPLRLAGLGDETKESGERFSTPWQFVHAESPMSAKVFLAGSADPVTHISRGGNLRT